MRALAALSLLLVASPLAAQQAAIELLADAEVWKTDDGSRLLARNEGRLTTLGRLYTWGLLRVLPQLEIMALSEVAATSVRDERVEARLEQILVRYFPSRRLQVEAGRVLLPVGAFATRRFSHVNPLIGAPDAYSSLYPWGVVVSGAAGVIDYRVAAVTLPAVDEDYVPPPGHALRPVLGLGIRSGAAFRVGVSATYGPYLGPDVSGALAAGASWRDYAEIVVALDARYSRGYVEARAEASWSSYEVPTEPDPVGGLGWYGEVRVTLGPRVFVAGRFEHNRYAFIRPGGTAWIAAERTQMNGELGMGYRPGPGTVVKASYRRDYWPGDEIAGGRPFPDGYAVAFQVSHRLDVGGLFGAR